MKITIDGVEYPVVRVGDWTFDEADRVKQLTKLRAGEMLPAVIAGDAAADKAYAVVAFLRADKDPESLGTLTLDQVDVDLSQPKEEAADGPPAVGDAVRRPRRRAPAKKSARKS